MTADDIIAAVNHALQQCFFTDTNGTKHPLVCISCDRFILPRCLKTIQMQELLQKITLLTPRADIDLPDGILQHYKLQVHVAYPQQTISALSKCLLSPRAIYLNHPQQHRREGYTVCCTCKAALTKGNMPTFCIANNYAFGAPPECLLTLTDVELAIITPIKTFGFCFSFTGGAQKQLKGSLSYYKINPEHIVRSVAHLDALQLNNHVVVLLFGTFTQSQYDKAKTKCKVRPGIVADAIKWLLRNNKNWRKYRRVYSQIVQLVHNRRVVLDTAQIVPDTTDNSTNQLLPETDSIQVFYPDGTFCEATGGQNNIDDLRTIVQEAAQYKYDIECRVRTQNEAVIDYKGNTLVDACLLQYPYGRGGLHESRLKPDGSISDVTDISDYISYVSMLSLPKFHTELFTLILYNMKLKHKMVKCASWKVRNKKDAELLGSYLTMEDVDEAIRCSRLGSGTTPTRGSRLLGAVDAVCKTVPHSNQAAKKARRDIECMQHHFGSPTYFLTVTPDDDNHIFIEIYSQNIVAKPNDVHNMDDNEIQSYCKKKTELRLRYPGICAYFYHTAIDIVLQQVIGWDKHKNQPIPNTTGIFGTVQAISIATEEQGRRSLHAHILIWVAQTNSTRTNLFLNNDEDANRAAQQITTDIDNVCSTACYFNVVSQTARRTMFCKAFPHSCLQTTTHTTIRPRIADDQQLRNLRCQHNSHSKFAYCNSCHHTWAETEFLSSYLQHGLQVPHTNVFYDNNVRRLKCLAAEFQQSGDDNEMIPNWIVDAAYNHHIHTASCFKTKSANHFSNTGCPECRYRYPQRKKRKTIIQNATATTHPWFLWNGECEQRHTKEVCLKRTAYDAFQNNYCPHISYSKLSCNTNISFVMPGPLAQYCVHYTTKNTQQEDSQEYTSLREGAQRALATTKYADKHAAEAVRRIMFSAFSHQSQNVVGAPMAAFLTRQDERFYFSHQFAWCPLRDIKLLLSGDAVHVSLAVNPQSTFFQCQALNYLCRPPQLEHVSAFEFYANYDVRTITSTSDALIMPFQNTLFFKHPSYVPSRRQCKQGVLQTQQTKLIKIFQYDFPDTATFNGNLLSPHVPVNSYMEQYSEQVLLLFLPYRQRSDMLMQHSFTFQLRAAIASNTIRHYETFLQNLQDAKSNNLRWALISDDLQRNTASPSHTHIVGSAVPMAADDDNHQHGLHELVDLEAYYNNVDDYFAAEQAEHPIVVALPTTYNCTAIRNKGRLHCGYEQLPDFTQITDPTQHTFIHTTASPINSNDTPLHDNINIPPRPAPTQKLLMSILFSHQHKESRSFQQITGQDEQVHVFQANGSVQSIIDWARQSNLDVHQQRAFEIITASLVLSFFNEATLDRSVRHSFRIHKSQLRKLIHSNCSTSNQLICLLHGAAGSGKTVVIDLVTLYARTYYSYLWQDVHSTDRLIVVTAMTGVAATLLQGETTHSAIYLNQTKPFSAEQIHLWQTTKMVIIDEISFASKQEIEAIDRHLRQLKQNIPAPYGGIHIVFSGDFRQLEPVGKHKRPLYAESVPQFRECLNCYIELEGMWRFRHDPTWGARLMRMRNGNITSQDIDTINSHIASPKLLPPSIRYATYFNIDRDAINTAIFEQRAKASTPNTSNFLMIFADNLKIKTAAKTFKQFSKPTLFWEQCSENDIILPRGAGRMDPVLKLYSGCRIMLPANLNVSEGQANGTQATVLRIVLKPGQSPSTTTISNNIPIPAVFASQVDHIVLSHLNSRLTEREFTVAPKQHTFQLKLPCPLLPHTNIHHQLLDMRATQLPILLNNATTGHKLQGAGVDTLFVHNWSYTTNWVYVMLSRVKTMNGLYARKLLSCDLAKYALSPQYLHMITHLQRLRPHYFNTEDYTQMILASQRNLRLIQPYSLQ